MTERVWVATDRQREFLTATADEVLYGGAAGGGKTDALLIFAIRRRTEIPNSRGLFLRRTFPELERSAILRSLELLSGTGAVYASQQHRWRFPNRSLLEFGYCESDEDVYRYQSAEYEDICFDEATQFTEFQYRYLVSRVRTTKPGVQPLIRAATNPGNIGHNFIKARFRIESQEWGQEFRDEETGMTRCFIPAKVTDNPHLALADPGYLRRLDTLPEAERKALKDGDWDVFAGQYYPEFNQAIHLVDRPDMPSWWLKFRCLDYGLDCCACYWIAVMPDRRLLVYRELYKPNLNLTQAAKAICEMTPDGEDIRYTVASPDLWNRRQDTGMPGEETMRCAGLRGLTPADDRRVAGWRHLREYLAPIPGEIEGTQTARLTIVRGACPNLVRTLPTLIHDDHNVEDVDAHCEDHGPEALRYGVMSRPRAGAEPTQTLQPGGTYTVVELRYKHGMSDAAIRALMRRGGYNIVGKV